MTNRTDESLAQIAVELRRMNRLWFLKERSELSREMTWKEHWDELHKIMED